MTMVAEKVTYLNQFSFNLNINKLILLVKRNQTADWKTKDINMTNNLDFVFVNKAFQALKNKGEKKESIEFRKHRKEA